MIFEYLTIDATTRRITVPQSEQTFGVQSDTQAVRKYFKCPRYVGTGLDLASMFLRVNFRNANGEVDAYLVDDVTVDSENVTFSWLLSKKATAYVGQTSFVVCAISGRGLPEWNTTLAVGNVLQGLEPDSSTVEAETADVVAQLLAMVTAQTGNVEAVGAAQVKAVQAAAKAATTEAEEQIQAKGEATLATIPEDYATLASTVDRLTRDRAAAIVCSAEGETVQVHDASNDPLQGLRIFGRSTQDGTPTPDNPVEIVSLPAPVVTITDGTEDNVQTLPITTPGSLPGIPVESGGNYTDADGQQWVCDEVDLVRGVYVQRVQVITAYKIFADTTTVFAPAAGLTEGSIRLTSQEVKQGAALCSHFVYQQGGNAVRFAILKNGMAYFTLAGEYSADEWKQSLAKLAPTVAVCLATPVETPLTDVELHAFRALHSVKPTTTVLNDAGAHMVLEYAADPKTYIDNKLAALVAGNN